MKPFKFLHMADCHLGYRQYNIHERFQDFNRSFRNVLHRAIQEEVDFVLIAGDMFHSANLNPDTLTAVYRIIIEFKDLSKESLGRDIPILAIEGNHDKNFAALDKKSWMEFLADLGLIILLAEEFDNADQTLKFEPYSHEYHAGGFYEFEDLGVRVYGMQYRGAMTSAFFPLLYDAIPQDDSKFNLLMMHFGFEGIVKNRYGIKESEELTRLHEKVDYLALGHYHKQYSMPHKKPWIYNPGSIEVVDLTEVFEEGYRRSVLLVEVKGKKQEDISPTPILFNDKGSVEEDDDSEIPNRAFYVQKLDLTNPPQSNFKETITYILKELPKYGYKKLDPKRTINRKDPTVPVLLLSLFGKVPYSRLEINSKALKQAILDVFEVLDVRIYVRVESTLDGILLQGERESGILEIEHDVFSMIIGENKAYKGKKNEILGLMDHLKMDLTSGAVDGYHLKEQIKSWWKEHHAQMVVSEEEEKTETPKISKKKKTRASKPDKPAGKPKPKSKPKTKSAVKPTTKPSTPASRKGSGTLTDYFGTSPNKKKQPKGGK